MAAPTDRRHSKGIQSRAAFLRENLELGDGTSGVFARLWSQYGASLSVEMLEEEITLATDGTATETTYVIPVNAIVLAVVTRVTEAITTAVNYDVGISGAATLYDTDITDVAKGDQTTSVDHLAGAAIVGAGDEVLITTNANPGAGKLRVTTFFLRAVAATS